MARIQPEAIAITSLFNANLKEIDKFSTNKLSFRSKMEDIKSDIEELLAKA